MEDDPDSPLYESPAARARHALEAAAHAARRAQERTTDGAGRSGANEKE